jgi:hypothetical protein
MLPCSFQSAKASAEAVRGENLDLGDADLLEMPIARYERLSSRGDGQGG